MEHTKHLEELNKETLAKLEEYMKTKGTGSKENNEKISNIDYFDKDKNGFFIEL